MKSGFITDAIPVVFSLLRFQIKTLHVGADAQDLIFIKNIINMRVFTCYNVCIFPSIAVSNLKFSNSASIKMTHLIIHYTFLLFVGKITVRHLVGQ